MTKTILGFVILIILQFISNLIIGILPIKFPAPILGMVIFVILLQAKIIKEEWIKNICELLLKHMALLFIPLFVGIIVYFDLIKTNILPMVDDYVKNSKLNIKVFAESKSVVDSLRPFTALSARVFNRNSIESCDAVMFFDYPADKQALCEILEKTSATSIHLMNYDVKHFSQEEFLQTSFKMLKYAVNYNNGVVELYKFASFLGKSNDVLGLLFSVFAEIGLVKILSQNAETITISLDETVSLSKVLHTETYSRLQEAVVECEEFQALLLTEDLDKIQELFSL